MTSNLRDHKPTGRSPAAASDSAAEPESADGAAIWAALLALRRRGRRGSLALPLEIAAGAQRLAVAADGAWQLDRPAQPDAALLLDLYLPLALASSKRGFVLAHLGQSLDGRIATSSGASQWLTGAEDQRHTHRLRALADAVIVGAATVRQDDPQLTVRHCTGDQPARIVLDANLGLAEHHRMFQDAAAPTFILAAADKVGRRSRIGSAEIVPIPRTAAGLAPAAIRQVLARRGFGWLLVEGGGITVSRFLAAGALDRLQMVVAPVILGSGRPSLELPEIADLAAALRPRTRFFALGPDMLIECRFHD